MKHGTITICGDGASAALLLLALTRFNIGHLCVRVMGTGKQLGAGIAYSTSNRNHLLNVPVGQMSADPLDSRQFKRWLIRRGTPLHEFSEQFVSRSLYADYLGQMLSKYLSQSWRINAQFMEAEVLSLRREGGGWWIIHRAGFSHSDLVVLATGNDMPEPIAPRFKDAADRIIDNPWRLPALSTGEDVLVLGTGLTAVDTVISLLDRGHCGAIHLLSRHGLLPKRHVSATPGKGLGRPLPATARKLVAAIRQTTGDNPRPEEWQGFMDGMRATWSDLWQRFPIEERKRVLRHALPYWNTHRHRLAPTVADRLEAALRLNVTVLKGRLQSLATEGSGGLKATIAHLGQTREMRVSRVINCTGPNLDVSRSGQPLIQNLIASGYACSGALNLGLDVDPQNRVRDAKGAIHPNLFAMGTLTKDRWWEITAIPDISRQATAIAGHLLNYLDIRNNGPLLQSASN